MKYFFMIFFFKTATIHYLIFIPSLTPLFLFLSFVIDERKKKHIANIKEREADFVTSRFISTSLIFLCVNSFKKKKKKST